MDPYPLVAPDAVAPLRTDCEEDWIRLPAPDDDVRVRASALAGRAARHRPHPEVKGDGRIAFGGRWVALSPAEEGVAQALAAKFGEVVDGETIAAAAGTNQSDARGTARIYVMRLRKRIGPLGLVVETVRGRGYVMEAAAD